MMSNHHHQNDAVPSKNAYIALREAKIARNEERLRALGLLSTVNNKSPPLAVGGGAAPPRSRKRQAPRQQPVTRRRQSARLRASSHPVNYTEASSSSTTGMGHRRGRNPAAADDATTAKQTTNKSKPLSVQQLRAQLEEQEKGSATAVVTPENNNIQGTLIPSNSARAIKLNVQKLLEPEQTSSNDNSSSSILGVPLARTGKAHVMQESARRAAVVESAAAATSAISFNKYAGIQEWGGDEATHSDATIFLWVNLGAPHCDVVNEFRDEGRQVVFYGGARMHDGSRVIQKLVRVGMAAATTADPRLSSNKKNHPGGVVLWCRPYLAERKTFGPYVCLGRLSVSLLACIDHTW